MRRKAAEAGFRRWIRARGLWLLSGSGEIQMEEIWIGCAEQLCESIREQLPTLAMFVKNIANQDAVAWETRGELFIR